MSPAFVDNGGINWRWVGYHARSTFAVLLSLAILVGGGWFVYDKAHDAYYSYRTADDYMGEGTEVVKVAIPTVPSLTAVGDILVEAGVVKSTKGFLEAAAEAKAGAKIQAGTYTLKKELPAAKAVEMLLDPANRVVVKVTIPEGKTLGQQWQIIAKSQGIDRQVLVDAAPTATLNLPAYANNSWEGFMFPDTYQVSEPLDAASLFALQVNQFNKVAAQVDIEGRAADLGITPRQLVIVASIIEKEAATVGDRPLVASVIYNRLNKGVKLQFDSTVHYAIQRFDKVTTTAEDRATDSPYNTYLYEGLPPGAISNPGEAALVAAANPATTDFYYFTAVNLDTGETKFATTDEEHALNVAEFQAWCQANTGRC